MMMSMTSSGIVRSDDEAQAQSDDAQAAQYGFTVQHLAVKPPGLDQKTPHVGTSGRIQTENYGFKVLAVPSTLLKGFSGHFIVQLDQICDIGSLFHGHATYCQTKCYA